MTTMIESFVALVQNQTDAQERVYPQVAPDGVIRPYIVYQRISTISNNWSKLSNTQLQVDVYATTYAQAQSIAAAVGALMFGWTIQSISGISVDLFEPTVKLHRNSSDYSIWHYT